MGNEQSDAVDPVRTDPANTQNAGDDQKVASATSAGDLEGVEVPEKPVAPSTPLKMKAAMPTSGSANAVAADPDIEAKIRDLASQAVTDKDHPLHPLGAGLPFGPAVLNILSVIYNVLNLLHQGGLIAPADDKDETKVGK